MFWKGRFYLGDDGSQNFKITDKNPSEQELEPHIHFRSGTPKKTGGNETIHCRLYKRP
jgi:hypothetical protein